MTKEEAEALGRKMADEDFAERFIDKDGNILDEDSLKEHIADQITCKVNTTDLSLKLLREVLEIVQGVRNDYVGVRYSRILPDRLIDRWPELDPEPNKPEPNYDTPFHHAREAYERRVLDRRNGKL